MAEQQETMSKTVMAIICFFLGGLGIHRFMMGYTGIGVLMLLTGGVFGILTLIDFVRILMGKLNYADGRALS
jgi:TM2 domain-containing membrane protein YozV